MEEEIKLTRHQRYYALHRAEKLSKENEKYNTNPEVIAKREERERKKAEREAEKAIKKAAEKEVKQQEKKRKQDERTALVLTLATKKVSKASLTSTVELWAGLKIFFLC